MSIRQRSTGLWACRTGSSNDGSLSAVVLVIIGAFLLIAIIRWPFYNGGAYKESKIKAAKVQISNFETAIGAFKTAVGRYPTTTEGLSVLVVEPQNELGDWAKPFMKNIPLDPWGNDYRYVCPGVHNTDSYDLWSFGPDGQPDGYDDIANWTEDTVRVRR
jgi:general secretion pathway protein G